MLLAMTEIVFQVVARQLTVSSYQFTHRTSSPSLRGTSLNVPSPPTACRIPSGTHSTAPARPTPTEFPQTPETSARTRRRPASFESGCHSES